MKVSRLKIFGLLTCLLFTLLFTSEIHAQAEENANFEAGIAAIEVNDMPTAYKSFLAAAKEGHIDSQFNVGVMYEQGIGVAKNDKEAVFWYRKAAAQGSSAAQYNLGVLYENGRGTVVDFAKANDMYRKASVQGDALAVGNLGMLYIRGDGVSVNKVAGIALLLQSVAMDPSPQNNAKQNITGTAGLTADMITEARALSEKLSTAKNMLDPLDEYLKISE